MIRLEVNNQRKITLANNENGCITVEVLGKEWEWESESVKHITEADFVMLLNYYNYVKSNDIQCDFINDKGKKKR